MADHWVSEVFPPKFEFKTVSDLLKKGNDEFETSSDNVKVFESYNRVYLEIANHEEQEQEDTQSCQADCDGDGRPHVHEQTNNINKQKEDGKAKESTIWTNDEIKILRKTFQKLKIQNVHLTGIVDSLTQELQNCKEREAKTKTCYKILQEKWSELKKRYRRAKISCKSIKEDLKWHHLSLKTARKELEELHFERNEILKDLNDTKVSLESERVTNSQLTAKLDEKEAEKAKALQHCEFVVRQQSKLEETLLKKEIFRLQQELKKEKDENVINRKSLENLRNHFVSSKMNANQSRADILSVADIDC